MTGTQFDDDTVIVLTPAGLLRDLTTRQTSASLTLVNTMINEAMAARDLLRYDSAERTLEPTGRPNELERYVQCRQRTEQALRKCGVSIEVARWPRTGQSRGAADA